MKLHSNSSQELKTAEEILTIHLPIFDPSFKELGFNAIKTQILTAMEEYSSLRNAELIEENKRLKEAICSAQERANTIADTWQAYYFLMSELNNIVLSNKEQES